jgi:hypothetical protein
MTEAEYLELNPQQRIDARKSAKKLWCVEVLYYADGRSGICRHVLKNLFSWEFKDFRETIISAGLYVPIDPVRGIIIMPSEFKQINVELQRGYWEENFKQ